MEAVHLVSLEGTVLEHLYDGVATPLAHGTCTLSLFSVPTHSPPSYSGATTPESEAAPGAFPSKSQAAPPLPPRNKSSHDQWLILSLVEHGAAPDADAIFELPIPSTSRCIAMPPYSFIIPSPTSSYELFNGAVAAGKRPETSEDEAGGFIKVTLSNDVDPNERELFESTLWGLTSTSFSSAPPPSAPTDSKVPPPFRTASSDHDLRSSLVLIDEKSGRVVGELETSGKINEDPLLSQENQQHEKEPVVIEFEEPSPGSSASSVSARPAWKATPNPSGSSIISTADFISRGIVFGAESLGKGMDWGAKTFVSKSKPLESPLVFSANQHSTLESTHKATAGVVRVSGKTVAVIGDLASGFGDRVGKGLGIQSTPSGKPPTGIKGLVNKSLVAFNTVVDGIETGGKHLLTAASTSGTQVVQHRYGDEAASLSQKLGGSVKHVALVYIDARGVTRRALLKSVGKSAIRARMTDGSEVILSQNDSGEMEFEKPVEAQKAKIA